MIGEGPRVDERYRVVGRLGGGGMADVYDAVDIETGRPVAIKVLRGVNNTVDARRFAAEIRTTAKLAHPCIVSLLDAGELDGAPYLVMERVDGGSLLDRLREGSLTAAETARVGAQVAAALAHAHDLGVVHRDVKPGNVLLEPDGRARLADFGIAVSATATRLTVSGSVAGSAAYVAPEQVLGHPVGPGADVYALGLVLLECLLGRPVYSGTAVEAALARLTRDPDMPFGLPDEWARVLRAMTTRTVSARLSADAAAQELAELATVDVGTLVVLPPAVDTEAHTTPGLILPATAEPAATKAGRGAGRLVTLLGTAITGVFLTGVGALAVPAVQARNAEPPAPAPIVISAEPDSWARAAGEVTPVTVVAPDFDEEQILRELRRWAVANQGPRTIVRTKIVRVGERTGDTAGTAPPLGSTTSSPPDTSTGPDTVVDTVKDTVTDTVDDVETALPVPDVHVPVPDTTTVTDPVDDTTDTVTDTTDDVTDKVKKGRGAAGDRGKSTLDLLRRRKQSAD